MNIQFAGYVESNQNKGKYDKELELLSDEHERRAEMFMMVARLGSPGNKLNVEAIVRHALPQIVRVYSDDKIWKYTRTARGKIISRILTMTN